MKSCYIPYKVSGNKYVENIQNILKNNEIEIYSLKQCLKSLKLFKEIRVFNFNWFEGSKYNNKFLVFLEYMLKINFIYILKIFNKTIIWTMHNKMPHDTKFEKLSLLLMRIFCKKANYIVIHCNESREILYNIYPNIDENKIKLIEHPNYIGNYRYIAKFNREKFDIQNDDLVFLFFGAVRPYKNIEILIDVFKDLQNYNIKLIIAGRAINNDYKHKIEEKVKGIKSINLVLDFIPDDEIYSYYNLCDVVILPYDYKSILNSGSIYLSFSFKKIVICPEIGTVKDIKSNEIVYTYKYDSETDHKEQIKQIINKIYMRNKKCPLYIKKIGHKAYEYVNINHNNSIIQNKYLDLYNNF